VTDTSIDIADNDESRDQAIDVREDVFV